MFTANTAALATLPRPMLLFVPFWQVWFLIVCYCTPAIVLVVSPGMMTPASELFPGSALVYNVEPQCPHRYFPPLIELWEHLAWCTRHFTSTKPRLSFTVTLSSWSIRLTHTFTFTLDARHHDCRPLQIHHHPACTHPGSDLVPPYPVRLSVPDFNVGNSSVSIDREAIHRPHVSGLVKLVCGWSYCLPRCTR